MYYLKNLKILKDNTCGLSVASASVDILMKSLAESIFSWRRRPIKALNPFAVVAERPVRKRGTWGHREIVNLLYGYFLGTNLESLGGIIWGGGERSVRYSIVRTF